MSDTTVPFVNVQDFYSRMNGNGDECELVPYTGEEHGFFNKKEDRDTCFWDTLLKAEDFLKKHGYL